MAYLKTQVDMGPRVPGTDVHSLCGDWLAGKLKGMGAQITDKPVWVVNPATGQPVMVRNILGRFNPDATNRIIVLAHYDTRPQADSDPDPINRTKPIDGANDGASGVAVALELARNAEKLPAHSGLDILLVDMEDSGTHNNDDSWCLGSERWVSHDMPYTPQNLPRFGILLDMVGGRNASFPREYFSERYASPIYDVVHRAAARTGHANLFVNKIGAPVTDDHLPFIKAGIPTVDIIDMRPDGFNPTWHTLQDNYDNIDPETIRAVGEVITEVIFNTPL